MDSVHEVGPGKGFRGLETDVLPIRYVGRPSQPARMPPRYAFRETRALPAALRGPVDCFHGHQRVIAIDCFALRSFVQPFAMVTIQ